VPRLHPAETARHGIHQLIEDAQPPLRLYGGADGHQTVAALLPAPPRRKVTNSGWSTTNLPHTRLAINQGTRSTTSYHMGLS